MAEDKKWITLKSGKRVKLDENGNVIAGFQGFMGKNVSELGEGREIKKYSPPSKTLHGYMKGSKNPKKAAEQYFADNLKNTFVKTKINGKEAEVLFTGKTGNKLKDNINNQPELAYFVDSFPSVLESYSHSGGNTKPREDFESFHYFQKTVTKNVNGKNVTVKIKLDVGVRKEHIETYEDYSASLIKDKKIGCIVNEYLRDQRENPAAATVGKSIGTSAKQPYENNIPQQGEIVNIDIQILEDEAMSRQNIIMDSASKRSIDRNGFMHVELCNITKESVDPYRGYEIPRSKEFGFDPDKIYMGYRSGEELKKAAHTFNGLPITREHHVDSAENPQREHRVGSIGTDCAYNAPYLQASVTITDGEAIRKIESGERMEFSAGYFFEPVFEKGEFEGKAYDFIMTEIKGNHIALVETGRAGADVCVADSGETVKNITNNQNEDNMAEIKKETQAQDEDLREELKKDTEFEEKKEELLKDECKPAADDDDDIEEILQKAGIETGDEELKKAFLAGMAYAKKELENPAKSEEVLEKKTVVEEKEDVRPAMDADTIKRQLRQELRDVQNAVREVRPLVGELDAMAFDSGDAVYFKACEVMGVNASKRTARDVCRALLATARTAQPAMDSALRGFRSRFDNN